MNSTLVAAVAIFAIVQDGPIPPQRVDPVSDPAPPTTEPVQPTDGRAADERATDQSQGAAPTTVVRPTSRIDFRQPAPSTMRAQQPASIFTDEAYRRARVRSLLMLALERGA